MQSYFITGATGYVGSMFVRYVRAQRPEADIAVLVRDEAKARRRLPEGVTMFSGDLLNDDLAACVPGRYDAIVHCAAITQSAVMREKPVETADSIVLATRRVLELARSWGVQSMVYVSSMEVYGQIDCSAARATEEVLGAVDLTQPRSCYPMGKRMAEQYCYDFFHEYGVPVKVARLAQTFGRGVPKTDRRVFAQFARSVQAHAPIVLQTAGRSVGNYCAIDDVVRALDLLLECGENGTAYNVVNEKSTMTIRQMAELAAGLADGAPVPVRVEIPAGDPGYAADTGLRLSGARLEALGWRPEKGLAEMYRDLLTDWERDEA